MNILIVEDDKNILSFLKESLRDEGFVLDTASDGSKGLEKALAHDYDLILLDNALPGMTGENVCKEIRKQGKNTRIMMLSIGSEAELKAKIINIGADDYLTKPFLFAELLARLKSLLRRPPQMKSNILCVKGLELDSSNHIVLRFGKEIHLTPKEFCLLEYLMRNEGKIISRMEILEHVWDMNADLFTNTVETHILNIRKKIGDRGKECLIHTVTGAGYKLA
ncbi:MAG TPA: response regulator transcription factor [Candidatus Paceibacterota bacterium]|nr:response regulator transcription factor [Candidatus Paceibacterota bacterium]